MITELKIAIIGVSHWHVPLYLRAVHSDHLNVVAVSDPNDIIAKNFSTELSCRAYTDSLQLLDTEKPDFVFAFAPHHQMPALAKELISRSIPFSMEKPMGLCPKDVEAIKAAAEQKDLFVSVPFVWRYSELLQNFKAETRPEDIVHMAFRFIAGPPSRYLATSPWMLDKKLAGGGCMTNLGIHFIDMALYLTGCTDADVAASCYHYQTEYNIECYASSLVRLGSGATLSLETGYAYPMDESQRDNRWNIATKKGYYTLENDSFEERIFGEKPRRLAASSDSDVYYPIFVRETLRQYENHETPCAGLPEMLNASRVLDKMNRKAMDKG